MRHDSQVRERKAQQQQAIEFKRELNLRMLSERREMKDTIKKIESVDKKHVDEALAKQSVDGAPAQKKKGGQKQIQRDASDSYRGNTRVGW